MSIPALNRKISAADMPLEKLAGSTQVSDREKVAEVSRQFEAVLLRQILSQAQKPLLQSSSGSGQAAAGIYQDMVTQQLADRISHGSSFGFAKVLEKQLSVQCLKKEPAPAKTAPIASAQQLQTSDPGRAAKVESVPAAKSRHLHAQPGKRI